MQKRTSDSDHDRIVGELARGLIREGFTEVFADAEGFELPAELIWEGEEEGFVPDISGINEELYLIEVETADSIRDEHTAQQWSMFAEAARQKEGRFVVAVPKGSGTEAMERLRELGLSATVWELRV